MSVYEHIEYAIIQDIQLHNRLKKLVLHEKSLFDENRLDEIAGSLEVRRRVERDIDATSKAISSLLEAVEKDDAEIDGQRKKTLSRLVGKLRENINETMAIVEQTGEMLQQMKSEASKEIGVMGKRKQAINSYMQNA